MGMDNLKHETKRGKGRGATNAAARLDGLGKAKQQSGDADWRQADSTWVLGIMIETTRLGGLVSFGLSRDRGAYNVTIILDGDRRTVWISSSEDLNQELEKICHFMASLPD